MVINERIIWDQLLFDRLTQYPGCVVIKPHIGFCRVHNLIKFYVQSIKHERWRHPAPIGVPTNNRKINGKWLCGLLLLISTRDIRLYSKWDYSDSQQLQFMQQYDLKDKDILLSTIWQWRNIVFQTLQLPYPISYNLFVSSRKCENDV